MSRATEAFASIKDRFDSEKAQGVDGTVQLDLTGEGGGVWAIKIMDGTYEVVEGGVASPTTTLTMSADDFMGMTEGKVNAMAAFMQGKIKLQGDMGLAIKFQSIFGMG